MSAAMSTAGSVNLLTDAKLDQLCVNTIRTLSIDAVQQAKSGHPGTPMALAPLVYTIWNRVLRFDPENPIWPNRDRFVLSNGHASMLLWSALHLSRTRAVNADYETLGQPSVTLDDIRRFRQLDSKAPGHPEYHWTSGVETTTGPLGQGIATSVGMAIAEKWLASRYNRSGFDIFDYNIYAVCGDGCLMEGVGSEAASLAGHLGLDNLCWVYDNNHITIEGSTRITFTEDVMARFLAYDWNVLRVGDANDLDRIEYALDTFRKTTGRPTLIVLDTHIGYGAPHKQDTAEAHGEPLGDEEVRLAKRFYGWPEDAKFLVPDGVYERFAAGVGARGARLRREWTGLFEAYRAQYPELANEIELMQRRELPKGWDRNLPVFPPDAKGVAGREASGKALNALAQNIPWLSGNPEVIIIATGSEVILAVEAHEQLLAEGIRSRVVSMPSWEIFDDQAEEYRNSVLPPNVTARVALEEASTLGWERYVGPSGQIIGMRTFGASAPLKELQRKFGFEPDQVVAAAKKQMGRQ